MECVPTHMCTPQEEGDVGLGRLIETQHGFRADGCEPGQADNNSISL